ncbi:hypothetical protein [Streptomyces sp. MNP-20]|uniref:hypothetical protein n=1 Tax=Streptomyces sp. MNP-20 TaxID=2721165 RepID=UPI001556F837|nr:hypothetical protein [Streptomyces sp. MNP-20]
MLTVWGWVCLGAGAGAAVGIVARAYAYRVRERVRRDTMTAMLHGLARGGGSAEVTEQDGVSWAVTVHDEEQR